MDPSPAIPRRRFVKLLAASAASLAMTSDPARAAAKTTERHRPAAGSAPPKSAALDKEIRTEKKSVADMLKVVRSYKLPAGSPPAMVFRPMKARRGRSS